MGLVIRIDRNKSKMVSTKRNTLESFAWEYEDT